MALRVRFVLCVYIHTYLPCKLGVCVCVPLRGGGIHRMTIIKQLWHLPARTEPGVVWWCYWHLRATYTGCTCNTPRRVVHCSSSICCAAFMQRRLEARSWGWQGLSHVQCCMRIHFSHGANWSKGQGLDAWEPSASDPVLTRKRGCHCDSIQEWSLKVC